MIGWRKTCLAALGCESETVSVPVCLPKGFPFRSHSVLERRSRNRQPSPPRAFIPSTLSPSCIHSVNPLSLVHSFRQPSSPRAFIRIDPQVAALHCITHLYCVTLSSSEGLSFSHFLSKGPITLFRSLNEHTSSFCQLPSWSS